MEVTRRNLVSLLALASATGALPAGAQRETSPAALLPSRVFTFDTLTPKSAPTGAVMRAVLKGKLATGELLEVHETMLPAGAMPHPAHHHLHSEMWLIREGTLEFTINGISHRAEAGGVTFIASNEEHGVKNVGAVPANYFVVAIGPGAA